MKDARHLERFMAVHGVGNAEFARIFGVSIRTVIYWKQGEIEAPNPVHLLVRAIQQGRLDLDWVREEVEDIQWGK